MTLALNQVRADFDRLAGLCDGGWDHNAHYHAYLLGHAPVRCRAALDIGSGTGAFTRLLATKADQVQGIDLSPGMVCMARRRSVGIPNIEYRVADFMDVPRPEASFDCIAALTTLHHVPLRPALHRIANLLTPGGVLMVLDLYQARGLRDQVWQAMALPASAALNVARLGRLRPPAAVRVAWAEHGRNDVYATLAEVHDAASSLLPGSRVRRHLLWRYSCIWRKPIAGG